MIHGKKWGTTEVVLASPLFEIHRLRIKPYATCSFHQHRYKWNSFLVTKGELFIDVEKNDYKLTDVTHLCPDDFTTVKPTEWHRFRTERSACTAYEMYYCEPLSADIIRRSVGTLKGK